MAGEKAPDFTLKTLDGTQVSLSDFKGKNVILLDFWAAWCPPCRGAMPALDRLNSQYADKGLKVISINQEEPPATVSAFLKQQAYKPLVLLDSDGSVCEKYGVTALPTFVLIDKHGKVYSVQSGNPMLFSVEEKICKLLGIKYKPPFGEVRYEYH